MQNLTGSILASARARGFGGLIVRTKFISIVTFGLFAMMGSLAYGQSALHCSCFAHNGSLNACLEPDDNCEAYCERMIGFSVMKTEEALVQCGSETCPTMDKACLRQHDDSNITWPMFTLDFDKKIAGTTVIDARAEDVESQESRSFCSPSFDMNTKTVLQSSVVWDWSVDGHIQHYCKNIESCDTDTFAARRMKVKKYVYMTEGSTGKVCLIVRNSWTTKHSTFHLRVWLEEN